MSSKVATALAFGLISATSAQAADLVAVQLPQLRTWCGARVLSKTDAEQAAVVDKAKEEIAIALDGALFQAGVNYSGMPFVASANKTALAATAGAPAPSLNSFRFEVCAPIAATALQAPPAPFSVQLRPAAPYSALPCGALTEEACVAELRQAMVAAYGQDKKDQISASPILLTRTAAAADATAIASAFQTAADRATFKALTVSGSGGSGIDLKVEGAERPLLLSSDAAVVVSGVPKPGLLVAAIPTPS